VKGLIAHDWIEKDGGAEKVLQSFVEILPNHQVFTLWADKTFSDMNQYTRQSFLSHLPFRDKKQFVVPLMPLAWKLLPTRDFDWALISTHLFAHHLQIKESNSIQQKLLYVHTPARYIWEPNLDSRGQNIAVRTASIPLRKIDYLRAQESVSLSSNSKFIQERIRRNWDLDSSVIYPPVEVERIQSVASWDELLSAEELGVLASIPKDFLFGASRLVKYKAMEDVIRVGAWANLPVVIAGSGPERVNLENQAIKLNVPVHFLGRVSSELMNALFQRSLAYVFPGVEDFGIMPVEAMATGAIVVANRTGGTSETIIDRESGFLVDFQDKEQCLSALMSAGSTVRSAAKKRAMYFSKEKFESEIISWLQNNGITVPEVKRV
jgi:glycosyltransferase involved in cell wall biosynthesis